MAIDIIIFIDRIEEESSDEGGPCHAPVSLVSPVRRLVGVLGDGRTVYDIWANRLWPPSPKTTPFPFIFPPFSRLRRLYLSVGDARHNYS